MPRPRDTQKERLYRAERAAAGDAHWVQTIPNNELQKWVDDVLARRAIAGRWGNRYVEVGLKRGGSGYSWGGRITLPKGGRNPWVMLHELAHELTPHRYASHGPEFAGVYLFLVRTVIGDDAGKRLLAQYRRPGKDRVRHNTDAIPDAGSRTYVTKTQKAATTRAAKAEPLEPYLAKKTARLIRRAVAAGQFGPAGRKPRTHALATARALEK